MTMPLRPPEFEADPASPFEHDKLGLQNRVTTLCRVLTEEPGPAVVSVNGGHRRNNRPQLTGEDRALRGAVAVALPRSQRAGWLVTLETLLRWHRRRIARHWIQPC